MFGWYIFLSSGLIVVYLKKMKFIWIFGPLAVGKYAVGLELSKKTGYAFMHNHATIELIIQIFPYKHPKAGLIGEFRRRIFEEVSTSDLTGFICTYVIDFSDQKEKTYIERINQLFLDQNHSIYYVELYAPRFIREQRNIHPKRLQAKPSKRDIEWSKKHFQSSELQYPHLSTSDKYPFFFPDNYIKIDNSNLTPDQVAEIIIHEYNLNQNDEVA